MSAASQLSPRCENVAINYQYLVLAGVEPRTWGKESGNSSFAPCLESLKMGIAPVAVANGVLNACVVFRQVGSGNYASFCDF